MSWTLAQAAQNERDPLRKGLLSVFWMESNLMAAIPWETLNRLYVELRRVGRLTLTQASWVNIADGYANATVAIDSLQEEAFKLGRNVDIPRDLANIDGEFVDPATLNVEENLKSIAYELNDAIINGPNVGGTTGTPLTNAITGMTVRIAQQAALAGLAAAQTATAANGTAFGPTASSANRQTVLDALDAVFYFIDQHGPDWGVSNQTFLLALNSAYRREGTLFAQSRDQFGRWVNNYRGVPIYDAGLKFDQQTFIITNAEVQGSSTDATSVYFAKNGVFTHFHGWEKGPLSVRDVGELQDAPILRQKIDWVMGLANWHPRCLARVTGIRATT